MRVLFVTWYPGYMRYYDGLIAELADRGNDVVVAFTNETKQAEGLVKARPDRTMVWNETQREEANVYHHIPP